MEKNILKRILKRYVCSGEGECDCGRGGPVRLAAVKDVVAGKPFCAKAGGRELVVVRDEEKFYALDNVCSHMGGPLCEGTVVDGFVVCPWHGSTFRQDTGAVGKGPAKKPVKSYPLEVRGEDLFVDFGTGVSAASSKPQPVKFELAASFDKGRPFSHEPFLNEVLVGMKFPFKLHGALDAVAVSQSADELDLHLGGIHATEMDLKRISALMEALNKRWGTDITYCLYHSTQFPGVMLLNIRGPKAPPNLDNELRFGV